MPEYDLVIRGGTLVDGTGLPRHKTDLAVKNGRVAKISGKIPAGGAKEIDASDCIVGPGAIDLHTHYDAQLNWDPYASMSGWFGVTSLTIGQCGFGFAPTKPEDREMNMRMLHRVEAIPLESMRLGMHWDWETHPEYLDSLERHGLGLNVGALFPFSPLRCYVLGAEAAHHRRSVTGAELQEMKRLFYEAMKAGAFGFSADMTSEDRAEDGGPLPSHVGSREEYMALAEVLGQFGVGMIGWTIGVPLFDNLEEQQDMLAQMVRVSGRKLNVLTSKESTDWLQKMRAEGHSVFRQMGVMSPEATFTLDEYNFFDVFPNWVEPLVGSPTERASKLRDPKVRVAMKRDVEDPKMLHTQRAAWNKMKVIQVVHDRNFKYEGLSIEEVAQLEQKHPLDAFLDLALDEDLRTEFVHSAGNDPELDAVAADFKDPWTNISLSDGGAHTRYFTVSIWPVHFLTHHVRDREDATLEEAHVKMSGLPAWLADFKDRGTLRLGSWADIMIYDLDNLGFLYPKPIYANDFPGGERRIIQRPKGLRYIIVNGTVTFEDGQCTGALPGKLLRSYDMVS